MVYPYCYYNGKVVSVNKVGLPLNDLGILRGYAVFDFIRTYNSKPFYFKDHFKRFKNSAKTFDLKVPVTEKQCLEIISSLMKKNKVTEASIRLVLTGGETNDGISLSGKPSFFILLENLYEFPDSVFKKGANIITADYQRFLPESKNTNYIKAVQLQKIKHKAKAIEILYINNGLVSEATTSNIFIIKNNILITPKNLILNGITRKIVISLAKKKLTVEEREVSAEELFKADECFITATNKKITPIVKIDNKTIGTGEPGVWTKKLLDQFNDLVKNY